VRLTRRSIIAVVAATVMLGLLAVPGNAAPEKKFSLKFPTTVSAGVQNIPVTLKNETPNGNSNINSFTITAANAPAGFSIISISPGTFALSNSNKTISITNIATLKPLQTAVYQLRVNIPDAGCNGVAITWTGTAFTGNSLNGDPFKLQDGSGTTQNLSQLTTTIASGCTTINVTKFNDKSVDGMQNGTEPGLQNWAFTLDGNAVGSTNANGALSFTASPGVTHQVCEVPQTGWFSTTGGNCQTVAAADATSGGTVPLSFGNALGQLDCTGADAVINVSGTDVQGVDISGVRIENKDGSPCIKIPYSFSENPDGGFIFNKDDTIQPQAQFLITQDVVRPISENVSALPLAANTLNGYTTEISYDDGQTFQAVPVCHKVFRDAQGNITGAELPVGMAHGYCIADQAAQYGVPTADKVTLHNVLYGLRDPITRTRPI
jgi:hypothetical protein